MTLATLGINLPTYISVSAVSGVRAWLLEPSFVTGAQTATYRGPWLAWSVLGSSGASEYKLST